MTNYERIQQDKAFCAWLLTHGDEEEFNEWMQWLDTEQNWKKRAALCNYKFGKEDTADEG